MPGRRRCGSSRVRRPRGLPAGVASQGRAGWRRCQRMADPLSLCHHALELHALATVLTRSFRSARRVAHPTPFDINTRRVVHGRCWSRVFARQWAATTWPTQGALRPYRPMNGSPHWRATARRGAPCSALRYQISMMCWPGLPRLSARSMGPAIPDQPSMRRAGRDSGQSPKNCHQTGTRKSASQISQQTRG